MAARPGAGRAHSTARRRAVARLFALAAGAGAWRRGEAAQDAVVAAEIDALLERLARSGCEFQRNGRWHAAADARVHLQRKREYLEARATLRDAEQFVELAASASSVSGKPYLVRCGAAVPVESGLWLTGQLQAMRSARAAPAGR